MTFKEAVEKLRETNPGRYRTLDYEYRFDSDGKEHHVCQIYDSVAVGNKSFFVGESWDKAFAIYEEAMKRKQETERLEGAPTEDVIPAPAPILPVREADDDTPF